MLTRANFLAKITFSLASHVEKSDFGHVSALNRFNGNRLQFVISEENDS